MKVTKNDKVQYGKTIKRLLSYVMSTYKVQSVFVFIAIIISSLATMSSSLFLMYLIDDFIVPLISQSNPDFTNLLKAILLMGTIYYSGVLCTYIYSRLMVNIGQGVLKRVRNEMFEHMQTLPIKYFDTHTHGELMSLYTNDVDTLRQMISQSIPQVFSSLITIIAISCVMLSMSLKLSVVAVIMVCIMFYVTKLIGRKSGSYFVAQQNDLSKVNGYIEEMMSGQKVVKVFTHEEASKNDFDKLNDALCNSATKANIYGNIMMPVINNIGNIQYVVTAIFGGVLLINGDSGLTLGILVSFLQFTKNFNMPFSQISQQFNSIVMALAGASRIFNLMDEKPEVDDGSATLVNVFEDKDNKLVESNKRTGTWAWKSIDKNNNVKLVPLCGDVRFNNMSFGYNEKKMVLHDISLTAKPGEKIAFVGSTGAGKTTITNLINRFYDINEGSITYDGIDIKSIKKDDLRKSLGIVLQDTHLFTGTIMENIRYGKLDATDEEVYEACKIANADQFINMLPNGYDTMIYGEGEDLSQGQRQLLAIARAAVANPPVLILDEATSSIDTRTESIVQSGMDNLMKGRTVFVIAHRLSTIRNSDMIVVLEHGKIIEQGTHDELIQKNGKYHQLYTGALVLE